MATQEQYRRCLEQLASDPPKARAALIRSLLPGIERALTSGQNLKDIWEALRSEGLQGRYLTFYMVVWRTKREPTAPSSWGKHHRSTDPEGLQGAKTDTFAGRDPLANVKRLEENRPGFHWRGTQSLKTLMHGTEVSSEKNNR
jgi:hypothetical protein